MFTCRTQKHKVKNMINCHGEKEMHAKLTKGLLGMIVMGLLSQEPMHGYQLIIKIRKTFGVSFGASTVYPFLERLEKKGYLKSEWKMTSTRPQKKFSLTKDGQVVLNFAEGSLNLIRRNLMAIPSAAEPEQEQPILVTH